MAVAWKATVLLHSQPVLPVTGAEHVRGQQCVGHCVRHDAVRQLARPDHPPVVEDAGEQTDVPVGTVLGGEKDGGHPERIVRVRSKWNGLKVFWTDEPAHQPAAPEQLLDDRHQRDGAEHPEGYEDQTLLDVVWDRALSRAGQEVVEEPVTSIRGPEHVRCDPEGEYGDAHQDAACPVAGSERNEMP